MLTSLRRKRQALRTLPEGANVDEAPTRFDEIVTTCRDLGRQARVDALTPMTFAKT